MDHWRHRDCFGDFHMAASPMTGLAAMLKCPPHLGARLPERLIRFGVAAIFIIPGAATLIAA